MASLTGESATPGELGRPVGGARRCELAIGLTLAGLAAYYVTTLAVVLGVFFGVEFVRDGGLSRTEVATDPVTACICKNGRNYYDIVRDGYSYDPTKQSLVAFFPAYPLIVRAVSQASGLSTEAALLTVSNAFLAVSFVLLAHYARSSSETDDSSCLGWTLLSFGLIPTSFFFRMAIAESTAILCFLLVLIGIRRSWPLLVLALLAGLASGTRPVGVAASGALIWYAATLPATGHWQRIARTLIVVPIACWGLLAYMYFQHIQFGNAFAFAQTQEHWGLVPPGQTWQAKAWALATLQPFWGPLTSPAARLGDNNGMFGLQFGNPIIFAFMALVLTWGARKKWLNGPEIVLGGLLLAIPYVTRAYEMHMGSHARFAALVVVNYPVIGRLLASWPPAVSAAALCLSGTLMAFWTSLYVSGHPIN